MTLLWLKPNEQNILKLCRIVLIVSLTISFYFVFQASMYELHNPGMGEQSAYASAACWYMGCCCIIAIPLWIHKIKAIRSFYKELNKIYKNDERAKSKAIHDTIMGMIYRGIPQIVCGIVFAVCIYYILSIYVITPELKTNYVYQLQQLCNDPSCPGFNFSNFTITNGTVIGSIP